MSLSVLVLCFVLRTSLAHNFSGEADQSDGLVIFASLPLIALVVFLAFLFCKLQQINAVRRNSGVNEVIRVHVIHSGASLTSDGVGGELISSLPVFPFSYLSCSSSPDLLLCNPPQRTERTIDCEQRMVSSALLLWFILPFALARQEHQQQESREAYQTAVALYFLSFTTSFFFFLFLSVLCIRWRISRRAASRVDGNILLHVVQSVNSRRTSGIDENLIKSLPLFQFSTLGCSSDGPVECAICLSKFESTDDVRLLPKCKHTFHMQCIDRWLQQHSNCPVCREKVEVQDSSPSIPLPETQSSGLMEQGTTQSPNGESLNRDRGGSAVGDNRDAQTPVRTVEDHLLDRRLMQQLQSYGIESVCSSSDQFLK